MHVTWDLANPKHQGDADAAFALLEVLEKQSTDAEAWPSHGWQIQVGAS